MRTGFTAILSAIKATNVEIVAPIVALQGVIIEITKSTIFYIQKYW